MNLVKKLGLMVMLLLVIGVLAAACSEKSATQIDQEFQEQQLEKAREIVRLEPMDHFLAAEALKRWRDTMNVPSKLWYVYRINDLGQYYAYNICDTIPLSYGVSSTSPIKVKGTRSAPYLMPATGIDAVYWSGTDPSLYYCHDAATGTLLHFLSSKAEWYDQPLDLESLGSDVPLLSFKQIVVDNDE